MTRHYFRAPTRLPTPEGVPTTGTVFAMFTNILLAVDTSEHSRRAVATAEELTRSMGGEVHVLHVRPLVSTGRGGLQDLDLTEHEHDIAEDVCRELQERGITATSSRIASYHGDTGHVIVDAARERGADLIVVGSRGHSRIPSILLGSVAHQVVHLSHCPVLIVR
ncbi:MAG: universal stress protein [Nocardioidaceae bacterium]